MSARYVLAPEADRVESVIREKIVFLAKTPGGGHWSKHVTDEPVKFFPVYSYLIVYLPERNPCKWPLSCTAAGMYREFSRAAFSVPTADGYSAS